MGRTIWTLVQADHDLIWDLLNGLTGGSGDPTGTTTQRRQMATQLVGAASQHEVAEERVLWPLVRRLCENGDELVGEIAQQESDAKRALNELEHLSAVGEEFDECVHTVAGMSRTHISYEQNQVWPQLADHLTPEQGTELAQRWMAARRTGPTRPHPHTPAHPAVLASLGVAMAGIDRARDALTGRHVPSPSGGDPRA